MTFDMDGVHPSVQGQQVHSYLDFPQYDTWHKNTKRWTMCKTNERAVGCMYNTLRV